MTIGILTQFNVLITKSFVASLLPKPQPISTALLFQIFGLITVLKTLLGTFGKVDIGIVTAYITAEACVQGLSTCILGWLEREKIQDICGLEDTVRLVIAIGYAKEDDKLREKKRKELSELVTEI